MKKLSALLLALLFSAQSSFAAVLARVPVAPAAAGSVAAASSARLSPGATAPGSLSASALHHRIFSQGGSIHPTLVEWRETGADGPVAALMLQAVEATSLERAGEIIFGSELDRVQQQLAAEIVLHARGELAAGEGKSSRKVKESKGYEDLLDAIASWKPGVDGLERIARLAPAAQSWRDAYEKENGKGPETLASWMEKNPNGAPQQEGGARWGGKGKGKWKGKGQDAEAQAKPSNAITLSEMLLGIFDVDDNLFVSVNGVWVFKKGDRSVAERIGSEEFARVREHVGKSGKYKDFEFWDDKANGSFREFLDQPGRNPLLENLKKAFAERELHSILGKSFEAFKHMLGVNPESVHILTAGGLSAEKYIEAFQWLKEQGYIPAVPVAANIQAVGNPKHKHYASTASPSVAKLKTMKELFDKREAYAKSLGERLPLLIDADGTGTKRLLPVGFSDDDHGNYATARDGAKDKDGGVVEAGLAQEFQSGRWPHLKIALYYTDRQDKQSGAYVIKPSGQLRAMRPAEFDETYVAPGSAEDVVRRERKGDKIPEPELIRSPLKSVWDAVDKFYFTVDVPGFSHPKVQTSVDQIALEAGKMSAFAAKKSRPGWKKRVVLIRYSIDDENVGDAMDALVDADVPVDFITDLNNGMDVDFAKDEPETSDFSRAKPKKGTAGAFIAARLNKGFRIHAPGAKWGIYSQPMNNHKDSRPDALMHMKGLLLIEEGPDGEQEIEYLSGSGNLATKGQRINLLMETRNHDIGYNALKHAMHMKASFAQGKPIDQVDSIQPTVIAFGNEKDWRQGEYLHIGYTDGHYNLNDMYVDVIQKTVDSPDTHKLVDADWYHFVVTYGRGFAAMKEALAAHKEAKLNAVVDAKFSYPKGWGKSPAMGGYLVLHPKGQPDYPWPRFIRDRVNAYDYQRLIEGATPRDLEGPPSTTFVQHAKVSLAKISENGVPWNYLSWGTFNFSGRYQNAEMQMFARMKADNPMNELIRRMFLGHAQAHPEWAIPLWKAGLRHSIGKIMGKHFTEVPLEELSPLEKEAKQGLLSQLSFRLRELLAKGTTLERDTIPADAATRVVDRFVAAVDRYATLAAELNGKVNPLNAQRIGAIATALGYADNSAYDVKTALRSIFYNPDLSREQTDGLVDLIWKAAGIDQHLRDMAETMKPAASGGDA